MSTFFEHIGPQDRIRRALNVLVEAPFFYREDDPDLFLFLRRNAAEFRRFFEELYSWQLVVDERCARVYKTTWHNPALKPSQHDVFDLTRRDDCLGFLLVLEFYEHLLEERNASIDDAEPLRFEFGQLFEFARGRLEQEVGAETCDDDFARRVLRAVMPTLLRYRFVRELEPGPGERNDLDADQLIYECMPALHHYDVRALGKSPLASALHVETGGEAQGAADAPGGEP